MSSDVCCRGWLLGRVSFEVLFGVRYMGEGSQIRGWLSGRALWEVSSDVCAEVGIIFCPEPEVRIMHSCAELEVRIISPGARICFFPVFAKVSRKGPVKLSAERKDLCSKVLLSSMQKEPRLSNKRILIVSIVFPSGT